MIYLFTDYQSLTEDVMVTLSTKLSDQRLEKFNSIQHLQGKREDLSSYLLLRYALRTEYNIDDAPVFVYNDNGKPYLKDHPSVHFNLSHCHGAAVCVVMDSPVGCDVQDLRRYRRLTAHRVCTVEELEILKHSDNKSAEFSRFWTRKEAVAKLKGESVLSYLKKDFSDDIIMNTEFVDNSFYITTACYDKACDFTMNRLTIDDIQ